MQAVTLTSAENALKSFYLDVVAHQLNTETNPLYNKIKQSENNVFGKEVRAAACYGVNGGIAAGTETGDLPDAYSNNYVQFVSPLKNLYGQIEISDKAIRASENSAGAFVNLLNAEMEGLLRAAKFNFGRMLFGDGTGALAKVAEAANANTVIVVDSARNLTEGMVIDIYATSATASPTVSGCRILGIATDNSGSAPKINVTLDTSVTVAADSVVYLCGSKGNEITGLAAIFSGTGTLYGLDKSSNQWMIPYIGATTGTISDAKIQKAIDAAEERAGSRIDMAVCSYGVRRAYAGVLETNKRNVNTVELEGGFRAISYAGIPIIADRFAPAGTMYLLDSKDFALHQLCDWRWLEGENGNILRQVPGKAVFNATLVKYAELMCTRPGGQAALTGITEG